MQIGPRRLGLSIVRAYLNSGVFFCFRRARICWGCPLLQGNPEYIKDGDKGLRRELRYVRTIRATERHAPLTGAHHGNRHSASVA